MKEARTRYARGEDLFDDGAYEQALLEFERAYELAPAPSILFNIGQIAMILKDYPRAIKAFEQYLCEGKSDITPKRKELVEDGLKTLYGRVAYIEVTSNVDGTEVIVDDISRGRTPLKDPIMVNAGRHVVVGKKADRMEHRSTLELAGTDHAKVTLEMLEPPRGTPQGVVTPPTRDDPGSGRDLPKPEPSEPTYWIGWVTTSTFAAAAVITGLLALRASSDLDELKETFGTTKPELDSKESERLGLAISTDVLAGLAIVSAGLSIWWTIADLDDDTEAATDVGFAVGPASFAIHGTF